MAKHKPSVALFEVIHAAKAKQQHQKSAAAMLRTPNWWFKGKGEHLAEQAAETFAADEPVAVAAPAPARPEPSAAALTPVSRTDVFAFDAAHTEQEAHPAGPATALPEKKLRTPFDDAPVEDSNPFALSTSAPAPARVAASAPITATEPTPPLDPPDSFGGLEFTEPAPVGYAPAPLKVDRDGQKVIFNLSYTAAIIGATAVFVIVAVAFIIGRAGLRPSATPSASGDMVQITKPQPDVLKNLRATAPGPVAPAADRATIAAGNDAPKVVSPGGPAPAGGKFSRVIGQQYVIVQSYRSDETLATDAVALLAKNGINATVERGLTGWGPSWYNVVGTQSFEKTRSNPDYDAYIAKVKQLSDQYAGSSRLKRFDPMAYKWTGK